MIAKVSSAACLGIQAYPVDVEVDVAFGMPKFNVVGLPDQSVKESKERVRSAIKNSGYYFPPENITINLAPADIKKEGPAFDLPMALGILAAGEMITAAQLSGYLFLGELALDGTLRPFKGAIAIASGLKNKSLIVPAENGLEAAMGKAVKVYPAKTLTEVVQFLRGEIALQPLSPAPSHPSLQPVSPFDFSEVQGQFAAKRALEIAVAGNHNILMIGAPGSGKSMLCSRIPTILPPLEHKEAVELTKIYSVAGHYSGFGIMTHRPFRSPHHSISPIALVGGGTWPKPGEISLAHSGVLFLDEFPEFRRDVLEALRNPLENGVVTISRAKTQITYPARFLLAAAMNPCPCGFLNDRTRRCRCNLGQIQKYQAKLSGPILDRVDLHIEVPSLTYQTLAGESSAESSEKIRGRILACRARQRERFENNPSQTNAQMQVGEIKQFAKLEANGRKILEAAMKELRLSARAYFKLLKIARTISDLAACEQIKAEHIAEAIQYRSLDRQWWN